MFLIQRVPLCLFAVATGLIVYTLVAQSSSLTLAQPTEPADSRLKPVEEDMHEYMEYVNQPTYQSLREAMNQVPSGDADWSAIKSGALILAESGNLIALRGPETDRQDWTAHAVAIRDAGAELYRAAHDQDFQQATSHYRSLLDKCNACHQQFAGGEYQLAP